MPPVGFEPTISGERPQTYASDRAATGIGTIKNYFLTIIFSKYMNILVLQLPDPV